jgi:hypothetical protein
MRGRSTFFTAAPCMAKALNLKRATAWSGLGGSAGDGRQFMSWIHHEDFIAAVRWLIDRDDIEGAVNVARRVASLRPPCEQVDARDWRGLHTYRNRTHSEEPRGS